MRDEFPDAGFSFGDNVRFRVTPLTAQLGLANVQGNIRGETVPSVTGVDVIGELASDYAVHVFIEDRNEGFWIAPQLLEFIDHAPGTEIRLEGVAKHWVRSASGEWIEIDDARQNPFECGKRPEAGAAGKEPDRSRWWKFW